MLMVLGPLGRLNGDVGGEGSLGRRGRAKSLDRERVHIGRRTTSDMEVSMVVAGH